MIERHLKNKLFESLNLFPATGLLGARQVGKTTLAREVAGREEAVYLDLENARDLKRLEHALDYLKSVEDKLVVLDEIQNKPEIFGLLRSLIDQHRHPGRFLILGSASPDLLRQSSQSLAGRIEYLELAPFSLGEVLPRPWRSHWLRGGFPDSFLSQSDGGSIRWREAFIATHLERDLPNLGVRIPASALRRFWQMLAHLQGQLWNASRVAASMGLTSRATSHYLDILEDTFMLRRLQPWEANLGKRLIKTPKVYLRDSGLLHALLGLETQEDLLGHPVAGPSFEGWALEQVLAAVPSKWRPYFYRTRAGAEIDLILEQPGNRGLIAVEFKLSSPPQLTKGFWEGLKDLQPKQSFVVAPVEEAYELKQGVRVIPPGMVGKMVGDK